MTTRLRFATLVALLMIGAGCTAAQTFTSARTLDVGKTEVTLVAGAHPVYGQPYGTIPWPAVGAQVRHGLRDGLEIGGGLSWLGLTGNVKVALLRAGTSSAGLSLALALAAGFRPLALHEGNAPAGGSVELPVLLGFHLGGGHEITLAPVARYSFGRGEQAVSAGGTLGMALRLSDAFVLTPELGLMVPLREENPRPPFIPSVGLGMTWGR